MVVDDNVTLSEGPRRNYTSTSVVAAFPDVDAVPLLGAAMLQQTIPSQITFPQKTDIDDCRLVLRLPVMTAVAAGNFGRWRIEVKILK